MALIEIILGEHPDTVDRVDGQAPIQYSVLNEGFRAKINGEAVFEPVAPLRDRFAKLKARDNILGAVLARLELGPNAGEDHAVAVLDRWLADKKAGDVWNDKLCATLTTIAKGLGLRDGGAMLRPDELASKVLAMNTELSSALAKAQERIKELEGDAEDHEAAWGEIEEFLCIGEHSDGVITTIKKMQARIQMLEAPPLGWAQKKIAKVGALVGLEGADLDALHQGVKTALAKAQERIREVENQAAGDSAAAFHDLCLAQKENAQLRAEVAQERAHKLHVEAVLEKVQRERDELETQVQFLKLKLTDADLGRIMAEATAAGMRTALQFLERAMREKLRT